MPMLLCLKKERYKVGLSLFNCCMTNDHKCVSLKQHKFISSQTYPSMSEYSAQGLSKLNSKHQPGLFSHPGRACGPLTGSLVVVKIHFLLTSYQQQCSNQSHASNISDLHFCTRWRKISTFQGSYGCLDQVHQVIFLP